MPGLTGVELVEQLRQRRPEIVRIIVTASVDRETPIDAINRGAVWKFIQKPWNNHALVELLGAAIAEAESERIKRSADHLPVLDPSLPDDASISRLDDGIRELDGLLSVRAPQEGLYQELLQRHPWMLGCEYRKVERHTRLDDENIPDFTGLRARDECRDIIEVKPPTLKVFGRNGTLLHEFNEAWNQAERYLSFVRRQPAYDGG